MFGEIFSSGPNQVATAIILSFQCREKQTLDIPPAPVTDQIKQNQINSNEVQIIAFKYLFAQLRLEQLSEILLQSIVFV